MQEKFGDSEKLNLSQNTNNTNEAHLTTSSENEKLKEYTQISENKLSTASTWSVNNIRCSEKIHRHLEKPKIDSIMSCLPKGIMTYLWGDQC